MPADKPQGHRKGLAQCLNSNAAVASFLRQFAHLMVASGMQPHWACTSAHSSQLGIVAVDVARSKSSAQSGGSLRGRAETQVALRDALLVSLRPRVRRVHGCRLIARAWPRSRAVPATLALSAA